MSYNQRYIKDRIIVSDTGCWEWQKCTDKYGYGQVNKERGDTLAHRLSYRAFKGDIPFGMVVRHKCDNPPCCNPEHLIACYQGDNLEDARIKGRAKVFTDEDRAKAGAVAADLNRIPQHIVEDVLTRFNNGEHKQDIANRHNIHISTTNRIIRENQHG